jgi:hypothetical protein
MFPPENLRLKIPLYYDAHVKACLKELTDQYEHIYWKHTKIHYLATLPEADQTRTFVQYLGRKVFAHLLEIVYQALSNMEEDAQDKRSECVTTRLRHSIEIADWQNYEKWHLNCTPLFYQLQDMTPEQQEQEMAKHNEEPEYLRFHL